MASNLVYYAQRDALGYPIPGTMMAVKSVADVPANTKVIEADDMLLSPPVPTHPAGLKFFVRHDKNGDIIPNSLFSALKRPAARVYEVQFQLRND